MTNNSRTVSVVQAGSDPFNSDAAIAKFGDWLAKAKAAGSQLTVFPEAFIGGFPRALILACGSALVMMQGANYIGFMQIMRSN